MSEHFTRATVSAAKFCNKCLRVTQHRVDNRRIGPCLECIARLELQHSQVKREKPAEQKEMF